MSGDEAWLAAIVRSSGDGIIAWDRDGMITCWNKAAEDMLGYPAAAIIGRPVRGLMPGDRIASDDLLMQRAMGGERLSAVRTLRVAEDGRKVALSVAMMPVLDADGLIIGVAEHWRRPLAQTVALRLVQERADAEARLGNSHIRRDHLHDPSILIVEDEVLTAYGLIATLENAGFRVIGPAVDVKAAMELLDRHHCELAILDVNLGDGETSAPLAERLKQLGIPFFVTSGYSADHRASVFNDAPNFPKPVPARVIVTAVRDALQ